MENSLLTPGGLAIVMSSRVRSGFDFVGTYAGKDEHFVYLKKPLVIDYDDKLTITGLRPYHLPVGMVDIGSNDNTLALPHEGIAYLSCLPAEGKDWIHTEYENFFNPPVDSPE